MRLSLGFLGFPCFRRDDGFARLHCKIERS